MQHTDSPNDPKDGIPPPEDKPPVNARFRERTDAERRLERLRRRVVEVCPRLLALGPRTYCPPAAVADGRQKRPNQPINNPLPKE